MLFQCPCMRTISISTSFYMRASNSELMNMCYEGYGTDEADPFAGSYLETGDRIIEQDEDEDPENYEDVISIEDRDFSIMDDIQFEV